MFGFFKKSRRYEGDAWEPSWFELIFIEPFRKDGMDEDCRSSSGSYDSSVSSFLSGSPRKSRSFRRTTPSRNYITGKRKTHTHRQYRKVNSRRYKTYQSVKYGSFNKNVQR